jgi:EpsD family peptidyl-prolyl cis-trans isomerase
MFATRLSAFAPKPTLLTAAVLVSASLLTACSDDGDKKDKAATQVAAKVNKEEISVHQINFMLSRQPGIKPEQKEQAQKAILESLISQELAYQQAEEQKIDRDPNVLQMLEAAKREIIVRAYLERTVQSALKPTEAEVKQYYDSRPAMFSERRLYNFQEILVEAKPEQIPALKQKLSSATDVAQMQAILQAEGVRFGTGQAVRAAEQLVQQVGYDQMAKIAKMTDGQFAVNERPGGLYVLILVKSEPQPVNLAQAKPAIEQLLLNERRTKLAEDEIKRLRAGAKIEYVGPFAPGPNAGASGVPAGAASLPGLPGTPAAK